MATTNAQVAFVQVKLKGSKEVDVTASVKSVEVEDNDRLIDKAKIVLEDPDAVAADVLKERLTVLIDMGWVAEHAVLFEGVVVKQTTEAQQGVQQVTIEAMDLSYNMTLKKVPGKTHSGKISEIIKNIVKDYHLEEGKIQVDPDTTIPEKKPLPQGNMSDWQFIQGLAEQYKGRAYVEYTFEKKVGASRFYFQPESQLLAGDRMGQLKYCHGFGELIEFKFRRLASGADAQRTAITVDPDTGKSVETAPAPPQLPEKPVAPNPGKTADLAKVSAGRAAAYEKSAVAMANPTQPDQHPKEALTGSPSDIAAPERIGRQDPTRLLGLFGEGTVVGTVKLRAKGKVGITGIAQWAEGDWYVRKVTHIYTRVVQDKRDRSTYQTKFVVTR